MFQLGRRGVVSLWSGNQLRDNNNRLESSAGPLHPGSGTVQVLQPAFTDQPNIYECNLRDCGEAIIENVIYRKYFNNRFYCFNNYEEKYDLCISYHALIVLSNSTKLPHKPPLQLQATTRQSQTDLKCNFEKQIRFGCGALQQCRADCIQCW